MLLINNEILGVGVTFLLYLDPLYNIIIYNPHVYWVLDRTTCIW